MNTSSDKINQQRSLTRYGVLTKKEVFKWNIHISAILNSDGDKRSDFFTFGPSNDAKFYLLLPATDSELSAPPFCSSSQFNLFLCRVWNNLEGKGQDTEMKIKVAISLLDLRERLHYTCERVMKDEDRVTATFDRSCYDKYHLTFLRDSYMTIHCALDVDEVIKESNSSKETCALVNFSDELYTKDLVSDFSSLLDSGLHSDVTLSVDGKDFQVHRAVLSARSEVFAAMFEHDTLEKKQNRVVIEDISSDAMSQLLKFLYTGQTGDMSVQAALALFVASDKYALPKLKSKCSDYLCYNIPVDMMLNVLIVANLHEDDTLKQAAIQGILNNAVQVMKSDDWLMFLKEYSELANNIILQLAMKSVQI